jgi:hypothetical protein
MMDVADNADDAAGDVGEVGTGALAENEPFAERIAAGPEDARECLIDDRDGR